MGNLTTLFDCIWVLILMSFIFTRPYSVGAYMLMDALDAIPGDQGQIRSPLVTPSSGCLDLMFHYYLYGTSTTMQISVYTISTGKDYIYLLIDLMSIQTGTQTAKQMCFVLNLFL